MATSETPEAAAIRITDEYLAALNAGDEAGAEAALHFPHIRISNATPTVWNGPEERPLARFRQYAAEDGWHHSRWNARRVLHQSESKVHLEVQFTRFRADESPIGTYTSIYVITRVEGRWGIQARSTFAP